MPKFPMRKRNSRDISLAAHRRYQCGLLLLIMFFMFCSACRFASIAASSSREDVRPPAVAGKFYPSDPSRLQLAVQKFMEDALPSTAQNPVAIIVPHAGYIFSGQICADAFHAVAGQTYEIVVILGTNHTTAGFEKIALYPPGAWQTPLGQVALDDEISKALITEDDHCVIRKDVHAGEHSVEVQVPFIQMLFPKARIVPAVIGSPDAGMCSHFGQALAKALKGKRALIVASSDLSHYPAYNDALAIDRQFLASIVRLDPRELESAGRALLKRGVSNLSTVACGEAPIMCAIAAAKIMGAKRGVVLSYANSGDTAMGDRSSVVGYGAVVLDAGNGASDSHVLDKPSLPCPASPLQTSDKRALLVFARQTLQRFFATETTPMSRKLAPRLQCPQGAFVTLKKHGELRGCIGHMSADTPLGQTVGAMAMQAAFNDRRFDQLQPAELRDLEIEISALTPWQPLARPEDIVIGRDGVVIEKNGLSAVFLPQVALEQKWDRAQMLEHLCAKAGLPPGGWKSGARFFAFQAEVFGESEFK